MPAIPSLSSSQDAQSKAVPAMSDSTTTGRIGLVLRTLVARDAGDEGSDDDSSDHVINILLIVLGIAFLALMIVSVTIVVRRTRLRRVGCEQSLLPTYEVKQGHLNHRGLKIETTHNGRSSVVVIRSRDAQPMLRNQDSPPHSPDNVPEIHITFPDEHDEQGRRKSGRVLVVRVGDNAVVGLEPMAEEQLPAYEKEAQGHFYSIDFDDIGGLKEKDQYQSQSVFEK